MGYDDIFGVAIYKVFGILLLLFTLFHPVVVAQRQHPTADVESFYDLSFTRQQRDSFQTDLEEYRGAYQQIHALTLGNEVAQPLVFNPYPRNFVVDTRQRPIEWGLAPAVALPRTRDDLAFYPVSSLAQLIKGRKITAEELTRLYLARLKRFGDTLKCVVTILEETALAQARAADREIAEGKYRGPLHGIPYGIKDLFAVPGTKTTWGARPYADQVIPETAAVVEKLNAAGAVLLVKLSLGALAMGDIWYGGRTRNPWNLKQGSSGSSAGSASATAAGLVAFSIGTETWGSIVSPSTRCGVTGLRPTYGSVSRFGAMALSWSMDKVGPICRSALDCALVFDAIRGADPRDNAGRDAAFNYDAAADIRHLKVGYLKNLFDLDSSGRQNNDGVFQWLSTVGIQPEAVQLPTNFPVDALSVILAAEAAAVFDALTRSGRDSLLENQTRTAWPTIFRGARFIPAVEYLNAQRIRQQLIESYHEATREYDVIITPTFAGNQLLMTNLTGHPCLVVPNGFNAEGSPTSISFLGKLHGEAALITLGKAYQAATKWDDEHPPLFSSGSNWLKN